MVTLNCRRETVLPVLRQRQKSPPPTPFQNYCPAQFTPASESLVLGAYGYATNQSRPITI